MSVVERIRPHVGLQTNNYTCGVLALRHAMLVHDKRVSVARLAWLCETTKDGVDVSLTGQVCTKLGFRLVHDRFETHPHVKNALRTYSREKTPVLLCLDSDTHWICSVHADARHVTVVDSSRPGPAIQRLTWRQMLRRLVAWFPKSTGRTGVTEFHLYPLRRS